MRKAANIAKWIAACAALFAVVAIIWGGVWWAIQPRHEGKTIHWWFARAHAPGLKQDERLEIERAFTAMGAHAVPFLLDRIASPDRWPVQDTDLRMRLQTWLLKARWVPSSIKRRLAPVFLRTTSTYWVARELLSAMGPSAISALSHLEKMLADPDEFTHSDEALTVLRGFGLLASNSAPIVAGYLSDTNLFNRSSALSTFAAITPPKSPHSRLLFEAIKANHIRAAEGLPILFALQADFTELVPKLSDELCMPGHSHSAALDTIRRLRLHQKALVPRFAEAMKDPDPRFRAQLLQEVRKDIAGDASSTLNTVAGALDDPFYYVRAEAAKTLPALRPRDEDLRKVLSLLHARTADENRYVVETALAAIKALEPARSEDPLDNDAFTQPQSSSE